MMGYSAFPKAHYQIVLISYPGCQLEIGGSLTPLQRCSQCILLPLPQAVVGSIVVVVDTLTCLLLHNMQ